MLELAIAVGLGIIGLATLSRTFAPLRGTTLRAAWWWAVAAVVAVTIAEGAIAPYAADGRSTWAAGLRFAAWALTLCPAMALLGAKRPQDRAWQWIVLAFWIILGLPGAQVLLLQPGQPLVMHPVWSWFLLFVIIFATLNHLPTRYGASGLAVGIGQTIAFWPYLPLSTMPVPNELPLFGLGLIALGLAAGLISPRRRTESRAPLDLAWLDFRDWYGVVWGSRVRPRIDATAAQCGWPVRLGWQGFTAPDFAPLAAPLAPETAAEIETSLRTLLRRFVSPEWIDRRLGRAKQSDTDPAPPTSVSPGG